MRFALALAATTALWVQPAQAATFLYVSDNQNLLNPVLLTMDVNDATPGAAIAALDGSTTTVLGYADEFGFLSLADPLPIRNVNYYGFFNIRVAAFNPDTIGAFNTKWQIGSISNLSFSGDPTPAVPEPSIWALMLLGFGAVGAALRRRATKAPVRQLRGFPDSMRSRQDRPSY